MKYKTFTTSHVFYMLIMVIYLIVPYAYWLIHIIFPTKHNGVILMIIWFHHLHMYYSIRLWAYLMKVITEIRRAWWRLLQKFVMPDEGYYRNSSCLMKVITEIRHAWWRLLQKHVVPTKFDIYVFIYNVYLSNYR